MHGLKLGLLIVASLLVIYSIGASTSTTTSTLESPPLYTATTTTTIKPIVAAQEWLNVKPPLNSLWDLKEKDGAFRLERWQLGVLEEWLTISPCVVYEGKKQPISALSKAVPTAATTNVIKEVGDKYEFGYIFDAGTDTKAKVSSLCYEVTDSSEQHIWHRHPMDDPSETWYNVNGNVLEIGAIAIDFSDIIAKGYTLQFVNNTAFISNMGAGEWNLDPQVKWNDGNNAIQSVYAVAINETAFVVGYCDDTEDDHEFKIYNTNGSVILGETDVDTSGGGCDWRDTGLVMLNETNFVYAWFDVGDTDYTYAIYNIQGTQVKAPVDLDDANSDGDNIRVSAFNSSRIIFVWADNLDDDITYAIVTNLGTSIKAATDIELDADDSYSGSVSVINETRAIIAWYDTSDEDVSYAIVNNVGTITTAKTDIDTDALNCWGVSTSAINKSRAVVGYYDTPSQDATFTIIAADGSVKKAVTDIDDTVGTQCYSVEVQAINSTTWVAMYYDSADYDLSYRTYDIAGNPLMAATDLETWPTAHNKPFVWERPCGYEVMRDVGICSPNWVAVYTNSTTGAYFQTLNATGGAWGGTCPSAPVGGCVCPGLNVNWEVSLALHCNITSACDIGTGILNFTGSGYFACNATIETANLGDPGNANSIRIKEACTIKVG